MSRKAMILNYSVEINQCELQCIARKKRVNAVVGCMNREGASNIQKCLHLALVKPLLKTYIQYQSGHF